MENKKIKRRNTELQDLDDETLIEILIRVPAKDGHRCKCVSKHWLSLISSPFFVHCHRGRGRGRICSSTGDDNEKDLFFQLVNTYYSSVFQTGSTTTTSLPCLKVQTIPNNNLISFDFLNHEGIRNVLSFVSNHDLVLIESTFSNLYDPFAIHLFVCNPITKQSYKLPQPPPFFIDNKLNNCKTDFRGCICSVDDPALYKVVLVTKAARPNHGGGGITSDGFLHIYVFSSDTNSWLKYLVPTHPDLVVDKVRSKEAAGQDGTTLNGELLWCTSNMIVIYNPFKNPQQCDFIDVPQDAMIVKNKQTHYYLVLGNGSICVANIEQQLRLYNWRFLTPSTQTIKVWDMKDYTDKNNRSWEIKHFVEFNAVNWQDTINSADLKYFSIKGFNPYDGDVMYVLSVFEKRLLAVNLRTKTVHSISKFKPPIYPSYSMDSFKLFPYNPPSWPTPILKSSVARLL
ncbi:uncharacterized protein LOC104883404 [Beta vulgaris subsp. vulgaris]|uniref:uncharacterized protein LOC104883404 n=1 Tax=Beta vulgaris subsp. vulgaris TaxID=3555 RepID=UPI00053FBFD2|nr:uncharacterized protein LOC104883404 [Beta vulgaris subsp. vulgaris]